MRAAHRRSGAALALLLLVAACALPPKPAPGIGPAIPWSEVHGWGADHQARAWPALRAECPGLMKDPQWTAVCGAVQDEPQAPTSAQVRRFFRQWFVPHPVYNEAGRRGGLMTAYFEPLVRGRLKRSGRFRYPLYGPPPDLLHIDLGSLYPALAGQRVRGRLAGDRRVVPYYSRSQIEREHRLRGDEIVWLNSPVTAFLMQVQGSGVVRLHDGSLRALRYADQNGYPYRPLLQCFAALHIAPPQSLDLAGLKGWLNAHPHRARRVLECNPSFVFFRLSTAVGPPRGALNVPLTARRSVAVDRRYIGLGLPVWLERRGPHPMARLVLAQDVGGAIQGPTRVDWFLGRGPLAGNAAGQIKDPDRLLVLVPRSAATPPRSSGSR